MKKMLVAVAAALTLLGFGASVAAADPSATVCHSVTVTVNGEDVVNNAACNVLPPQ